MRVKLVEIISSDSSWKGTWYKTGERHFVVERPGYPNVYAQKWRAIDVCGGINEADCREVRGLVAWAMCVLRSFRFIVPEF